MEVVEGDRYYPTSQNKIFEESYVCGNELRRYCCQQMTQNIRGVDKQLLGTEVNVTSRSNQMEYMVFLVYTVAAVYLVMVK